MRWLAAMLAMLFAAQIAAAAPRCALGTPGATGAVPIADTGRAMLLHRPRGIDDGGPLPLLILLHGSTGTGARMLRDTGLEATADAHGFLLAAPDGGIVSGGGFVWAIPGVPTVDGHIPDARDPDDVRYIERAIDWLAGRGCIDPARVYVTGLSGGGRMTSWLGCVAAARIAGIAPVVGLRAGNPDPADPNRPDAATCRPARPMPVIAFAGDRDTTNPIQGGGAPYWHYTMHAAEQRWAMLNGCAAAPVTRWIGPRLYEERYTGCRDGADVAARVTVGGGHRWVVDNDALWAFLSTHRRAR